MGNQPSLTKTQKKEFLDKYEGIASTPATFFSSFISANISFPLLSIKYQSTKSCSKRCLPSIIFSLVWFIFPSLCFPHLPPFPSFKKESDKHQQITKEKFHALFGKASTPEFAEQLFNRFDRDHNGYQNLSRSIPCFVLVFILCFILSQSTWSQWVHDYAREYGPSSSCSEIRNSTNFFFLTSFFFCPLPFFSHLWKERRTETQSFVWNLWQKRWRQTDKGRSPWYVHPHPSTSMRGFYCYFLQRKCCVSFY